VFLGNKRGQGKNCKKIKIGGQECVILKLEDKNRETCKIGRQKVQLSLIFTNIFLFFFIVNEKNLGAGIISQVKTFNIYGSKNIHKSISIYLF
jgi:hypothetical protein